METTEQLTKSLLNADFSLTEIKGILIHENRPKEEWSLVCCLVFVNCGKKVFEERTLSIPNIIYVRNFLLKEGYPAYAKDGGIDFWAGSAIIELLLVNNIEHPLVIAETLRDSSLDFLSAAQALGRFFNLTVFMPNVLIFTEGKQGIMIGTVSWPS